MMRVCDTDIQLKEAESTSVGFKLIFLFLWSELHISFFILNGDASMIYLCRSLTA